MSLSVPAASLVSTSNVAWRSGRAWFSVAVGHELRIYRWQQRAWALDGAVQLPDGFPDPQLDGNLSFAHITAGRAPDATVLSFGADTLWFAFAARVADRWRFVPFDDQFGRRDPYTLASGVQGRLIDGVFDACGCAAGPTTDQWYRFARGEFVATDPPVGRAVCSAAALGAAEHWPPLRYDPLVRDVGRPFRPVRFACAHGWALARDGQRVAAYEQHGRRLDQSLGRRWLRVAVGPARLFRSRVELAAPRSLLQRLGREIGLAIPPAPSEPNGSPRPLTRQERAPITLHIRPGDRTDLSFGSANALTVTIHSSTRAAIAMRFRWRNGAWTRLPASEVRRRRSRAPGGAGRAR